MKISALLVLLLSSTAFAQLQLPDLSPRAHFKQTIGYTNFELQYGRPSLRGRIIFGALVNYDKLWRTGGGKCTLISFDTPVTIAGKQVAAGTYAFLTIPGKSEWTILLNSDTSKVYGDPSEYDVTREVARLRVKPEATGQSFESLTIWLDHKQYDAELFLAWENTRIHFTIATRSHEQAKAKINEAISRDPLNYEVMAEGAHYYNMLGEPSAETLKLIEKSLSVRENRWAYHQKIDLLEKSKRFSEARATALKAIAFLKKEKPDGEGWTESINQIENQMKRWPK